MKIETLDLTRSDHYSIAENLYEINKSWLIDDETPDFATLAKLIQANLDCGSKGVICYINNELYGILYARIDRYKNADIQALTSKNHHFFVSQKFLRAFIEYLFDFEGVNKVKAEIRLDNHNAEIACRYAGLTKEGFLRHEMKVNKRFVDILLFAITRKDYDFQSNKFPNKDKKFYRDIKKQERKKVAEIIRKIRYVRKK